MFLLPSPAPLVYYSFFPCYIFYGVFLPSCFLFWPGFPSIWMDPIQTYIPFVDDPEISITAPRQMSDGKGRWGWNCLLRIGYTTLLSWRVLFLC